MRFFTQIKSKTLTFELCIFTLTKTIFQSQTYFSTVLDVLEASKENCRFPYGESCVHLDFSRRFLKIVRFKKISGRWVVRPQKMKFSHWERNISKIAQISDHLACSDRASLLSPLPSHPYAGYLLHPSRLP